MIVNDFLITFSIKYEQIFHELNGRTVQTELEQYYLLKECASELGAPLATIFQKSMDSGMLPRQWKATHITPLFKKGKRSDPGNYRPINLASVPAKIMEKIIKDNIMQHLIDNNLITRSQHGFMPGRSCTTNLLEYMNEVTKALDNNCAYDAILLDYRRAFDRVSFRHMLEKVKSHGICGRLLNWIENWTLERFQRVVINGELSDWIKVTSSVVQGSVLGPVLFSIFINDLDFSIDSSHGVLISKFADDTKLGKRINNTQDCNCLQSALDQLVKWSKRWNMSLHPDKCVVIHFGRENPHHLYSIDGKVIGKVEEVRDLGITISNSASQTSHVNKIAKKGHAVLSQMKRTVTYRDSTVFASIYRTYVRPTLENCVQVWNPAKLEDIKMLRKSAKKSFTNDHRPRTNELRRKTRCATYDNT